MCENARFAHGMEPNGFDVRSSDEFVALRSRSSASIVRPELPFLFGELFVFQLVDRRSIASLRQFRSGHRHHSRHVSPLTHPRRRLAQRFAIQNERIRRSVDVETNDVLVDASTNTFSNVLETIETRPSNSRTRTNDRHIEIRQSVGSLANRPGRFPQIAIDSRRSEEISTNVNSFSLPLMNERTSLSSLFVICRRQMFSLLFSLLFRSWTNIKRHSKTFSFVNDDSRR